MIKHKKNFLYLMFCGVFATSVVLRPGYADYNEGCQSFSPAFVLCSVHSHNIGYVKQGKPANPNESEQITDMNEVIALKSTVIAQQLKKQYDALNAVIKRFKTQLEKAVLVSKMELITGETSSSSGYGGSYSSGNSGGLANAQDCDMLADISQVYDCIIGNLQKVKAAAASDTSNARKQLGKDIDSADGMSLCYTDDAKTRTTCTSQVEDCKKAAKNGTRQDIEKCAQKLAQRLRSDKDVYSRLSRTSNSRWQ
jgi:hypothetical protein